MLVNFGIFLVSWLFIGCGQQDKKTAARVADQLIAYGWKVKRKNLRVTKTFQEMYDGNILALDRLFTKMLVDKI